MAFLSDLELRATEPGEWALLSALIYMAATGKRYIVPRGFITDLASIPRPVRGLFSQTGLSRRPAVLHDFLYCAQFTTRAEADNLFLEALKYEGAGWAMRYAMFLGVRAGGWLYWNKRDGIDPDDFATTEQLQGRPD
jgi:hypothetical protein